MTGVSVFACVGALVLYSGARAQEPTNPTPQWTQLIAFSGDFRYRHERTDMEGSEQRTRQRIRLRFGFDAKLPDDVAITVRLATGGGDPISTNQTLGEGFTKKPVALDLAYVEWRPAPLPDLGLLAGKMRNPFHAVGKNQLMWDSDLTPEGIAVQLHESFGKVGWFTNAGGFWVAERSQEDDTGLFGFQNGVTLNQGSRGVTLTGGFGFFTYTALGGRAPIIDQGGSRNTLVVPSGAPSGAGVYASDFSIVESFAEAGFTGFGVPIGLFGEYVRNVDARSDETGWIVGMSVGRAKNPGTWQFGYQYRRVEPDAVLGAFTDSDFAGGGTDAKGHTVTFEYRIAAHVTTGATYQDNEIGLRNSQHYRRLYFDVSISF